MIEKTKYSNRGPISMDSIPIEDTEIALNEFSGNSNGLAKGLRALWQNGVKTYSSYAEVQDPCDIAYIKIEKGKDLFCFLSPFLISDCMVQLDYENEMQVIRFAGNRAKIEGSLLALARDIQSGRKRNEKLVAKKLYVPFPEEWLKEYYQYKANQGNKVRELSA